MINKIKIKYFKIKNNLNNFKSIGRMTIFKITTFWEYKMLNLPIYFAKLGRL